MKITTSYLVPSRKAAFVMPTSCISVCTAHRDGAWTGVIEERMGEVSVVTAADRGRTAVATTDQLVPGTSAWSPPT